MNTSSLLSFKGLFRVMKMGMYASTLDDIAIDECSKKHLSLEL